MIVLNDGGEWEEKGVGFGALGREPQKSYLFQGASKHGYQWKDWCWSWNSNTLATWCEELTHWKRPWCWERLRAGGEGDGRGWDGWMVSPTQRTWVWAFSRSCWWIGKPGVLQSMGWQRVRHDWVTELNWTEAWVKCFKITAWVFLQLVIEDLVYEGTLVILSVIFTITLPKWTHYLHPHIQMRMCYQPHLSVEETETWSVQVAHSSTAGEWCSQSSNSGFVWFQNLGSFHV